ncbi:MAG: twin-arginine translocase TatA/TatE family subunit [Kiritimatiellia bacterium]
MLAPAFLFGTGVDEWALLGVIVFLLFGPRRLPEIARTIGRTLEKLRRAADEIREQLAHMDDPPPASAQSSHPPQHALPRLAQLPQASAQPPAISSPPSQAISGTHADVDGHTRSELRLPNVDTSQQDARV